MKQHDNQKLKTRKCPTDKFLHNTMKTEKDLNNYDTKI